MSSYQDKKWELKLYPDANNYDCNAVLLAAQQYFDFWAYILHDQDFKEDGSPDKPHYHFYGKSNKKLTLQGIAYQLQVPDSSIQYVKTWKGAMRYLTHIDYPEKHVYSLDEVFSNFSVEKYYRVEFEDQDQANMIFEFIMSTDKVSPSIVAEWVFHNGCWSTYRRGYAVFNHIIKERQGLL